MKFITADEIHRICEYPALVNHLERLHREEPADLKDMLLANIDSGSGTENNGLFRAAWASRQGLGIKAATIFPDNTANSSLPAIHAIYMLFEGVHGTPVAVMDGTVLTYYKTAADSALGSKYLARGDIKTMAMIGAGAMAPHLITAHCSIHSSIQEVYIWNRTASKALELANKLSIPGGKIQASEDIQAVVQNAELVSSATMTREPIIFGDWLNPGTHVDLVGAFTLDMRETDDNALLKSRIFVDSRKTTIGEIGEIQIPIDSGIITEDDINADLYQLCTNQTRGRISDNEITMFKNGGGGHLDLMTAGFIYERLQQ